VMAKWMSSQVLETPISTNSEGPTMPKILKLAFGAILALVVPALPAEPVPIGNPDKCSEEIVEIISQKRPRDAADLIANTVGKPDASDSLQKFLQIFEDKNFDFTKKVIDKDYNGAVFRFNFKMTSTGWILAHFSFKDETNELFPKDFTDR
jgi:hypothetical protein